MDIDELISKTRFTIFLGKNGSGKSTLLRNFNSTNPGTTKYVSPERGGTLKYEAHIEETVSNDENWIANDRRKNRTEYFRQQSAMHFRNLELLILREIEQDINKRLDPAYTFNNTISRINKLLCAVELHRFDRGFRIYSKTGILVEENMISSGEAELIALAIEVLIFSREKVNDRILLLDEPDVHLHPDLQHRFIEFIKQLAVEFDFKVVIATHSTAIIGAFLQDPELQIVPITSREQADFKPFVYSSICNEILPVFGAHPLSTQFNRMPILLVEGEDDKRVIEQIVRSSKGRFMYSPCVVGTVNDMSKWEIWLNEFLPSIYDNPMGFSLRDLDDSTQCEIEDVGCVSRTRLNCYSIENLLLTDECLAIQKKQPQELQALIRDWILQRPEHSATTSLKELAEHFDDRRTLKIKDARNVLVALLEINKPWEVAIGQLLAKIKDGKSSTKDSIQEYLGPNVLRKLFDLCYTREY